VENGFYYDVDLPHRISPDDFEKIEAEMKSEIKANHLFERVEVSPMKKGARAWEERSARGVGRATEPSKFKLDIIENIRRTKKFRSIATATSLISALGRT